MQILNTVFYALLNRAKDVEILRCGVGAVSAVKFENQPNRTGNLGIAFEKLTRLIDTTGNGQMRPPKRQKPPVFVGCAHALKRP